MGFAGCRSGWWLWNVGEMRGKSGHPFGKYALSIIPIPDSYRRQRSSLDGAASRKPTHSGCDGVDRNAARITSGPTSSRRAASTRRDESNRSSSSPVPSAMNPVRVSENAFSSGDPASRCRSGRGLALTRSNGTAGERAWRDRAGKGERTLIYALIDTRSTRTRQSVGWCTWRTPCAAGVGACVC